MKKRTNFKKDFPSGSPFDAEDLIDGLVPIVGPILEGMLVGWEPIVVPEETQDDAACS